MQSREKIEQWAETIAERERTFRFSLPEEYQKIIIELLLDIRELLTPKD